VADYFPTPTTALADLVLPAAMSLEREALVVKSGRHVMLRRAAIRPRGEARPDAQVLLDLGCRLGMADRFWHGDFRASVRERLEGISGVSLEDLLERPEGIEVAGAALLERAYETRGFRTPSGKIEFESDELRRHGHDALPVYREPRESPVSTPELARAFPLVLTTGGRSRYFTHSRHRNIHSLRARDRHARIQIHPDDACARGIRPGDAVEAASPRGTVVLRAEVTDIVPPGVVHAFHGWPDADINHLTDDAALDPISGFPAFKSSLCEIRPA
jgi:anaerobic selenocysteine-containing dehydrogenase